jgi:hypothetical protein
VGITREEVSILARKCLARTEAIMKNHRYRIAGTDPCRASARDIAASLRSNCDAVEEERFVLHPRVLWWTGKIAAIAYVVGGILGFLGGPWFYAGSLLTLAGLFYTIMQYVICAEVFDRLFPGSEGCNVVGILEPAGRVDRQVLLVGHHDSPHTLSFLTHAPQLAYARFFLGIISYLYLTASLVAAGIGQAAAHPQGPFAGAQAWLVVIGLLFAAPLFFFSTNRPSPGAGDNLNATSLAMTVAEYFYGERQRGNPLAHTRLVVLSTDGEEVGQRGAIHHARAHRDDLRAIPARVFNIDSVYKLEDLSACTRDRNCTTGLSKSMADELVQVAAARGLRLRRLAIPFGGGGTDAAAFAMEGIAATSVIGLPTGPFSRSQYYHTERDTVDRIEPRAVEALIGIAIDYVRKVDDGTAGGGFGAPPRGRQYRRRP